MNNQRRVGFAAQERNGILLLALSLGLITWVECVLAKNAAMVFLAIGLNVTTFVLSLATVYGLRCLRAKKKPHFIA